mmetsp:Transcript_11628/g.32688  ORF Transcript_11628/g.32688 Transcript_11628/m.32688 type:complete len:80 (+) Transcript_11628:3668-3907(+)
MAMYCVTKQSNVTFKKPTCAKKIPVPFSIIQYFYWNILSSILTNILNNFLIRSLGRWFSIPTNCFRESNETTLNIRRNK